MENILFFVIFVCRCVCQTSGELTSKNNLATFKLFALSSTAHEAIALIRQRGVCVIYLTCWDNHLLHTHCNWNWTEFKVFDLRHVSQAKATLTSTPVQHVACGSCRLKFLSSCIVKPNDFSLSSAMHSLPA